MVTEEQSANLAAAGVRELYINFADSRRMHAPAGDWIASGKAMCGAELRNPGMLRSIKAGYSARPLCGHCARKVGRTDDE